MLKLNISQGNSKLGKIPNLNLPPVVTCRADVPCHKDCYAQKAFLQYPNVRKAWNGNLEYYKKDPRNFFRDWDGYLRYNKPELFRIHSSGDLPDEEYLEELINLISCHRSTTFLMFTKRYDWNFSVIPNNFKVYFSTWPGLALPSKMFDFQIAWLETDERKPEEYFRCPGNCQDCGMSCWKMKNIDIVFPKH